MNTKTLMNTKKWQSACFSLGLCLAATLVSAAPFVSSHGYSVSPPPGWRVESGTSGNDVTVLAVSGSDIRNVVLVPALAVRISPGSSGLAVEALKDPIIAAYRKEFPGFSVVSQTYSSLGGVRRWTQPLRTRKTAV